MRCSTTLTINTPCTESWDQMTSQAKGRHCASCQKIVYDFTSFSDAELVAWFTQHTAPTCGRLRADQLGVRLYADSSVGIGSRMRGWIRWGVAFVLGWQSVRAQVPADKAANPAVQQPLMPLRGKTELKQAGQEVVLFYIRGQVVYPDGQPVRRAVVEKVERGTQVVSDTGGQFIVPIYEIDQRSDSLLLRFEFSRETTISVSTKQEQAPLLVTVSKPKPVQEIVGGGLTIIQRTDPPKRKWGVFRRSTKR